MKSHAPFPVGMRPVGQEQPMPRARNFTASVVDRHYWPSEIIRVGAQRGQGNVRRKRAGTLGVSSLVCLLAALANPLAKLAGPPRARHLRTQGCEECLRRNWPDHIACGNADPTVARISSGTRWTTSRARHLGALSCEDVTHEIDWTISCEASPSPELRVSPAKRARPPRERQLGGRSCEDVSGETDRTT